MGRDVAAYMKDVGLGRPQFDLRLLMDYKSFDR